MKKSNPKRIYFPRQTRYHIDEENISQAYPNRPTVINIVVLLLGYLMGPYNAGPNFTPAPLIPALITPVSKIPFPPFRAGVKRATRNIY